MIYFDNYRYAIAPLNRKSTIFQLSSAASASYSRWKAATYELALMSSSDPSTTDPSCFFRTQLICWHMKCSTIIGDPLLTSSGYMKTTRSARRSMNPIKIFHFPTFRSLPRQPGFLSSLLPRRAYQSQRPPVFEP